MLLKQYKELKYRISQNLPSEKYSTISSDASFFFLSLQFWRRKNKGKTHMGNTARGEDE